MTRASRTAEAPRVPPVALTLRRLAADLRGGGDVRQLLAALQRALRTWPDLPNVALVEPGGAGAFPESRLALPLLGEKGTIGMLHLGGEAAHGYGAAQLHLASAVADVTSVVLDHAIRVGDSATTLDMLDLALGGLSVGLVCYGADGVLFFANAIANDLLGDAVPRRLADVWTTLAPGGVQPASGPFVQRKGGRVVHITIRRPEREGRCVLVITDLTPRVVSFGETIAAEAYRALVEKRALSFVVLSDPGGSLNALNNLGVLGARFGTGTRSGPLDAEAAGLIIPGVALGAVLRELRALPWSTDANRRVGVATLREDGDTPKALVARARAALEPWSPQSTPELLVFDESPSVTEALAFILRNDCVVTCSNLAENTIAIARERRFDGMIFELPSDMASPAGDAVRRALRAQPGLRTFFLTDLPGPWNLAEVGLPAGPVFRKPFPVREVRDQVRAAFASAGS